MNVAPCFLSWQIKSCLFSPDVGTKSSLAMHSEADLIVKMCPIRNGWAWPRGLTLELCLWVRFLWSCTKISYLQGQLGRSRLEPLLSFQVVTREVTPWLPVLESWFRGLPWLLEVSGFSSPHSSPVPSPCPFPSCPRPTSMQH